MVHQLTHHQLTSMMTLSQACMHGTLSCMMNIWLLARWAPSMHYILWCMSTYVTTYSSSTKYVIKMHTWSEAREVMFRRKQGILIINISEWGHLSTFKQVSKFNSWIAQTYHPTTVPSKDYIVLRYGCMPPDCTCWTHESLCQVLNWLVTGWNASEREVGSTYTCLSIY
jgi:hypothetical protein